MKKLLAILTLSLLSVTANADSWAWDSENDFLTGGISWAWDDDATTDATTDTTTLEHDSEYSWSWE